MADGGSDGLGEVWRQVLAVQPAPSREVVLGCALVALLLVAIRPVWRRTRHVVTIAHEASHAAVARLSGRRLAGIRLHSDTSGIMVSVGRRTGPGMVLTVAAGYPGPSLLGLAAAAVLSAGHALAVLWGLLVLLAGVLLLVRNLFGLWSVLVAGAVVFAVSWELPGTWQSAFAYVVTWFLLLAGPRAVVDLQRERRRGRGVGSDADQLARLTRVPALIWVGGFLGVTLGCLGAGSWALLPI